MEPGDLNHLVRRHKNFIQTCVIVLLEAQQDWGAVEPPTVLCRDGRF